MYELAARIIPCYLGTADIMDLLYSLPVSYFFDFTKLTPQFSVELFSSLCKSSCFRIRLFKPPLQKKKDDGVLIGSPSFLKQKLVLVGTASHFTYVQFLKTPG